MITGNKYLFIFLILAAGVACWLFTDKIMEILAGLFLGGGAIAASKKKAEKAVSIADEHEEMADIALVESVQHLEEAKDSHNEALALAEDDTEPQYENLPDGFTRKSISSE